MTPAPQPPGQYDSGRNHLDAPAEPTYSHEETARLLAQIKGYSFICSETAFDLSAQLARADARVKELENVAAREKARADAARNGYVQVSNERDRLGRELREVLYMLRTGATKEQLDYRLIAALTHKEE